MRNILILIGASLGVFVLLISFLSFQTRKEDPRYVLRQLRRADAGEKEQLIMRFKLARGDRVTPMIEAFADSLQGYAVRVPPQVFLRCSPSRAFHIPKRLR